MRTVHIFSNKEREQLLKEFCKVNTYSYHMVCKVMYNNLLGVKAAEEFHSSFSYFVSGKLGINHGYIKFELED